MTDFEDIVSGLQEEFANIDTSDVVDMTTLSLQELLDVAATTEEDLLNGRQAVFPREQWARDMHSLRYAARMELMRRQEND